MRVWLLLFAAFGVFLLANIPLGGASAGSAILLVSYPQGTSSLRDYVTTDKPYYVLGPGESAIVHLSGHVSSQQPRVTITIGTPFGDATSRTWNTDPSGYFVLPYLVDFSAASGTYKVTVSYNGGHVSSTFGVMRT